MMASQKTGFMKWIDGQLQSDEKLARDVDVLVNEMKIEQELVALREGLGLSQRQAARLMGTSQPYVAKLESGQIKNLGVKTLVKCATALGGRVVFKIERRPAVAVARKTAKRKGVTTRRRRPIHTAK